VHTLTQEDGLHLALSNDHLVGITMSVELDAESLPRRCPPANLLTNMNLDLLRAHGLARDRDHRSIGRQGQRPPQQREPDKNDHHPLPDHFSPPTRAASQATWPSLDPVGLLQLTDIPDNVGQFAVSHLGLRGHVSEQPVMGPNPTTHGQRKGGIRVMTGPIDGIDQSRTDGAPGTAWAVAPGATLDVRQLTRTRLRRKLGHDNLPSRWRRASRRPVPDPVGKDPRDREDRQQSQP
jgi:hypothetical protein